MIKKAGLADIIELADTIKYNAAQLLKEQCTKKINSEFTADLNDKKVINDRNELLLIASKLYKMRRFREDLFNFVDLFADPAWDILLDLLIAHLKNQRISVSSACLAAQVPPTTALRWINGLVDKNLIEREKDTADLRKSYVRLTPTAIEYLSKTLGTLA